MKNKDIIPIKIGNIYKDNLGRTNLVVRRVTDDSELKKYHKGDDQDDGVFWELETINWESMSVPHSGEPRMNCYWKQSKYIREYYNYEEKLTNKTMKITNLVKKILDKDTRTLVSAGFINGDLALTDEGVSELLGLIFLEKKSELVKIAEEKIDDSKTGR